MKTTNSETKIFNMKKLYPYQLRIVREVIKNKKLGLFLGMGLGKTLISLVAMSLLKEQVGKFLVIAPYTVAKYTWKQEAEKHGIPLRLSVVVGTPKDRIQALESDADVYIINREQTGWLFEQRRPNFKMLVVDESTSFKSASSQRFRALKRNLKYFERVLLLTGTPVANNLLDLWAQIYLLDKGERLESGITKYKQKYFRLFRVINNVPLYKEPLPGAKEIIIDKIKDITFTMENNNLSLPKVQTTDVYVDIPCKYEYKQMEKEFIIGDVAAANAAVALQKLQQIANGFLYGGTLFHEEKLRVVRDIVEQGEPVLCFYWFQQDKKQLLSIGGKELNDETIKLWNEGKIPLLVAHPQSAGFGLNLQKGGRIVVWFSLPWSWELYAQGNARLNRTGQTKQVLIYRIIARGTVDERVAKVIQKKKDVSDYLINILKDEGLETIDRI